ncbi:inter-alpha-trypsin inhibitor heavy chain H4-like isoform X5 [Anthonomus grandis grandis]|uniref:inter-alpha-trypsin inhibitor heavy chain H4-like isoform X5 n=1 Tax=Anthonomus grandis grandis TaxID=2921223 RepID=UPI0021663D14|nr:inter-alpha-trypsin inhibitor heavy chain H4-like isoform X5 [Anthonomus grandis grandis]
MKTLFTLIGLVIYIAYSNGASLTTNQAFVVSTTAAPVETSSSADAEPKIPKIYEMRVETNVSNRYAKTLITSRVKNLDIKAQEATFSVVTPDKAFISSFVMEIDGKKYEAYVQEKEEAKKTYEEAISKGQSAAHVAASARDSHRFTVSVNVEPESKAIFYLTYEELLTRKSEKYEVVLNINPGQPVKDLSVQVNVVESRPLKFVKVPSLRTGNEVSKNDPHLNPEAEIKKINETFTIVSFSPDVARQKVFGSSLGGKEEDGLTGQFVVQYDVERDPQGGEVLVDGGYFVHFFAPDDLPPLKKQVVFVLDTSGSMSGIRITQLKEAMDSILSELKPEDLFSIVEFNSVVKVWNIPEKKVTYQLGDDTYFYYEPTTEKPKEKIDQVLPASFQATAENINKSKEAIKQFNANGGTDIESALKIGLQIIAKTQGTNKDHQPIIVFLTDGEPTVGETITSKITSKITELNSHKVPIFSLSFGEGADRAFLQKISLNNQGFARHIYEAADAYLQLEDFYKQISSPLLSNVTFKYVDNVENVTRTVYPILFRGGEIHIAGITKGNMELPTVEGLGINGPIILKPKVYQSAGSLERLWAYLTVKQLLDQREIAEDKEPATREALKLALKYSFVTDVSSLVVVKPNASSTVGTEDASKVPSPFYGNHKLGFFVSMSTYQSAHFGAPSSSSFALGGGYRQRVAQIGVPLSSSFAFSGGNRLALLAPQSAQFAAPSSGFALSGGVSHISRPQPPFHNRPVSRDEDRIVIVSGSAGGYAVNMLTTPADIHYSYVQPSLVMEEDADESIGLSTTHNLNIPTANPTINNYLPSIPWLKDVLSENGTITLDSGTYSIGLNQTLPDPSLSPDCPNSENNLPGKCTLLEQCPVIHKTLVDFVTYKKHSCVLQSFAGVCCPLSTITPVP